MVQWWNCHPCCTTQLICLKLDIHGRSGVVDEIGCYNIHPTSQKTNKHDMTFDGTNISLKDGHLEPTKGHFWYLYNN